jgi:CRISPR-associated protein Csh2
MENQNFNNRVFGLALIKSINSNFNADFTGQPRTLPDGRIYATDKALKYSIRHFIHQQYPEAKVLYYKRLNEKTHPYSLAELYDVVDLGEFDKDFKDKPKILKNILSCIDVRLFGSTFTPKKGKGNNEKSVNLSVHGTVQVNHGLNQFHRNDIPIDETYSEQISAPFRSDNAKSEKEAQQATIGRQSKLREGHYSYHFSINPKNLSPLVDLVNKGQGDNSSQGLTQKDITILKEGLRLGVTHFDSSSKAGSDNELLLWVQLKDGSKKVMPSFTEMVKVTRSNGKVEIDLSDLKGLLSNFDDDIEIIELYYSPENSTLNNIPESAKLKHLLTGKDLN